MLSEQAQRGPDRLNKPRARSGEDRLARPRSDQEPDQGGGATWSRVEPVGR